MFMGGNSFWWHTTAASIQEKDKMSKFDIYHPMSGILLRADLRRVYEARDFVFLPVGHYWVANFFDPTSELGKKFDQRPIVLSQEIPKMLLLVRVAIAAFTLAKNFIEQGEEVAVDEELRAEKQDEEDAPRGLGRPLDSMRQKRSTA
jgi:hypothetical protein